MAATGSQYCKVVGTDEIMLKTNNNSDEVDVPESYTKHKDLISKHLEGEKKTEIDGGSNGDADACQEDVDLGQDSLSPLEST